MKIHARDYDKLQYHINAWLQNNPKVIEQYETGYFYNSYKVKDLQKRFCFDVLYMSGMHKFVVSELYAYLDDSHVYTALKNILPTIERRY